MKSKPARVVVLLCLMVAAILVWLVTRGPAAPVGRADSLERAEELPAADGAPGARDDSERSPEGISNPLGGTILPPRKEPAKAKEQPKPYRLAEHLGDDTNSGLRVKVVDEGGVPWSGARIWASRYGRDGLRDRTKRESAADGAVELLGLQPGKWQLLVGAGEMNRITKVELVGGRMTEATIEMSRTGGIMQGVVRHRRKGPLAEVTVRLSSHGAVYNDYLHARTDEGGGYRLSAIPPGTYSVYAEGEGIGYPPRRFEDLVVEAGETVVRDLAIGVVSLGGLVQDAATGRPLAGVEVNLQKPVYRMRNTDPDGRYSLFDLPSGDGVLVMSKEGYELYWVRDFKIVAGEQQTIDVSLQPAATIVFEVVDSEGRPVVGRLSLSISRPEEPGRSIGTGITADEKGRAVYRKIAPGTYDLTVYRKSAWAPSQKVEIRAGETVLRFQLPKTKEAPKKDGGPKVLVGTVRDSSTDLPIPGVRVEVQTFRRQTATTDAEGRYVIRNLDPGDYKLYLSRDGYGFQVVRDVKVEKGEERTLDLQLHPAATVHLFVVDPKGRPVAGRLFFGIHAKNEGGTRVGTSVKADDEGRATYRQIVPGPYSLRVLVREIGEAKVEVEILPGENRVEVRLE